MPQIDITECARRAHYKPNKSGRDSIHRWFLSTPEERAALRYEIINNRGYVDEERFTAALARVRAERQSTGGPVANLCRPCAKRGCSGVVNVSRKTCPVCGSAQSARKGR